MTGPDGEPSEPHESGAEASVSFVAGQPAKLVLLVAAFSIAFVLDQSTKFWVGSVIEIDAPPWPVIDGFFYLSHMRNAGTALGFFEHWPVEVRRVFFSLLAALAGWVVVLFYRGLAPGDRLNGLALGCIVGGGLGNLLDRLMYGEVIDFLHFRFGGAWSFPDFNVADVFIVIGVMMLMIELLVSEGVARAEVIDAGATVERADGD